MKRVSFLVLVGLVGIAVAPLAIAGSKSGRPKALKRKVDFKRDVQPILARSCYACHGSTNQKGGLRLDSGAAVLKGGKSGAAVIAGKSAQSRLIRLVTGQDAERVMPPAGDRLKPKAIAILRAWIDQGASTPEAEVDSAALHWAFQPVKRPTPPKVKSKKYVNNAIDQFVVARLKRARLKPSRRADQLTLLRRVSLDLIGLPPTIEEIDAFLADESPDAYGKLVERLLASPQYGEHWARWWLDAARYADTNGYEKDNPRVIWKYRDWVIEALNDDKPFDQFTIEQIAGDMLPNATTAQKIATGFHRNTMINQEGGVDQEQFRWEAVVDRVSTTGTVFLGLSVGCAQCHNHKYDPITQEEYWRMFAFLNNADEPNLDLGPPEQIAKRDQIRKQIAELDKQVKALPAKDKRRADLTKQIADLRKQEPKIVTTMVMQERVEPRVTRLHTRGDFLQPGEVVTMGVPASLHELPKEHKPNRLTFARWLVDERNPLTSRVTMNRVWQSYFGRGLVRTTEDFGTRGERPTHPELLDWLASEFQARKWSLKAMHRLIVHSATYQQWSRVKPKLLERDPDNLLLARGPRFRVDAEVIRDSALRASGLLSSKIGGPSVFSPQPPGVTALSYGALKWTDATGEDRYRRGLYTFLKRTTPYAAFMVFDATSREACIVRRNRSNTPLQALTTLNDVVFIEAAQALAQRVMKEGGSQPEGRVEYAFRLCLTRLPEQDEIDTLMTLWEAERQRFDEDAERAAQVALGDAKKKAPEGLDMSELAAWTVVSRVLLNLDEAITKE